MEQIKPEPSSFESLFIQDSKSKFKETISLAKTTQTTTYLFVQDNRKDCFGLIVDQDQEDQLTLGQIADQISYMLITDAFLISRSYFLERILLNKPISLYKDSQPLYYTVGPAHDIEIQFDDSLFKEKDALCLRVHDQVLIEDLYKIIGEKINRPCDSFLLERQKLPLSVLSSEESLPPKQLDPEKAITIKKTDTIGHLKSLIEQEFQMPIANQTLTFNNTTLGETATTLESNGIGNGDTIRLTGPIVSKFSAGFIPLVKNRLIGAVLNNQERFVAIDKDALIRRLSQQINLKVVTLTGKTIQIEINLTASVAELKEKIYEKEGIPTEQQSLIFSAMLVENSEPLFEYGIGNEATLHLVIRCRPATDHIALWKPAYTGYVHPKDASTAKLSDSGPDWRAVKQGLCLEGTCKNKECSAYDQVVIINHNFGSVDIISASKSAKCPQCSVLIESTTSAVNNCTYSFSGIKLDESGKKVRVVSQKWWVPDQNLYVRFDPRDIEKQDIPIPKGEWLTLTIHAVNLAYQKSESWTPCPLCETDVESEDEKKLEFGHRYHGKCFKIIGEKCKDICLLCHVE